MDFQLLQHLKAQSWNAPFVFHVQNSKPALAFSHSLTAVISSNLQTSPSVKLNSLLPLSLLLKGIRLLLLFLFIRGELQRQIRSWLAMNFNFLSVSGVRAVGGVTGHLELLSTAIMDGWMAGLGAAMPLS